MMRFSIVGIIICQIAVQPQAEKFQNRFSQKYRHYHDDERNPDIVTESRFRSNREPSPRDFSNFDNRVTRRIYDIPVTYKAPRYEANDYWKTNRDYYTQRTFFEDYNDHAHHTKSTTSTTTPFESLYHFMSAIFGGRSESESEFPEGYHHYDHNRITPSHKPVTPYGFSPTEPNYIPPPKPIRASVIKLETITRSPVYPPYDYETTTKYYPHVGTILNHVLIENAKAQRNFSWNSPEPDEPILPFKPLPPIPVLPRPGYQPPTTLKPHYPHFYSNHSHHTQTDYKYPESVQDQLPHLNLDDVVIPYVSEKPIPHIFIPQPSKSPPRENHYGGYLPASDHASNPNYIRSLNVPRRIERPINVEFETTSIKSFPGAVEKVSRPTFRYSKKLTAQLDKNQAERVANLTVLGFSKKIPKETNRINYPNNETSNVKNTTYGDDQSRNSSTRLVNLNDELSLDAKILKDTNWDGLTVSAEPSTDAPKEATTVIVGQVEPKAKPNVTTAFWQIIQGPTTILPTEYDSTETTTTEQTKIQTTTEFIFWTSTTDSTETNEPIIPEETTTPRRIVESRSENTSEDSGKENPEKPELTFRPDRTFRRKYNRRPKTVNFTPYPTPEELQKKLINRNHFPKRQKPNITLSFGNKNVLKPRQTSGTEEVMKFSDEDVRKRKIGKRRHVYKRLRTSTLEPPNQSDQS